MKATYRFTTISAEHVPNRRDDATLKEVLSITLASGEVHQLRIDIRSNTFDHQSSSKISRWDGSQWHVLHALNERKTRVSLASVEHTSAEFEADRAELLRVAVAVLS